MTDVETIDAKGEETTGGRDLAVAEKMPIPATGEISAIIPRNPDEAWRLSEAIFLAGMVPDSYRGANHQETKAKIMIGIMKGMEIGLAPISALSSIMIVNNRPSLWGDGAMALIQRSGKLEWIKEWLTGEEGKDDWTAHCEMKRVGQSEPYRGQFSWGDANRAKLTNKGPWMSYGRRMLRWRAFAWPARDGFADALFGLSIAEEVRDMPAAPPALTDKSFLEDAPAAAVEGPSPEPAPTPIEPDPTAPAPDGGLFPGLPEVMDPKWQRYVDEAGMEIAGAGADDLPAMREGFASEWERDETPEGVRAKVTARLDAREAAMKGRRK